MITTTLLQKEFIWTRKRISSEEFINSFILPMEQDNSLKENISENHDSYLLKIREWNI